MTLAYPLMDAAITGQWCNHADHGGLSPRGHEQRDSSYVHVRCLNTAEGAGRVSRPDKARAFTIARGEACEAAACVEMRLPQVMPTGARSKP
jgi:hypothetical protein